MYCKTNLVLLFLGLAERCATSSLPIEDDPIPTPLHELPQSLRTEKSSLPMADDPNLRMA